MTKVLVVDDLEENIKALSYDLSADGFDVISALNGSQALKAVEEQHPDIVLLDLIMPGMDGFEVCRRLKGSPLTRDIPVIIVSALDSHESIVKGLDEGAQDYITKPYYYPIVAARVRSALRQKRTQEMLSQLNADLDNARLMAESGARAKTTFLTNMSHEIRTPMNGVIGMAHLLANSNLNQEQRGYLGVIQQASESLLNLIDQILDYSKIETGKVSLENKPFNLREAIDKAVESVLDDCQDKHLPLHVVIGSGVAPGYIGDAGRIQQILHNLFSNAVKFTEQGEVSLHVSFVHVLNNRRSLLKFVVEDTGVGFDTDVIEQLFENFSQGDDSTQRQYGGVGLGLAICRRLANLLGGDIEFTSVKGKGTQVSCSLPLQNLADEQTLSPGWHGLEDSAILVVSDQQRLRHVISQHLSTFGCEALLCDSTEEALDELNLRFTGQEPPAAVLVDEACNPDWTQLSSSIHEIGKYTKLPLVLITASGDTVREKKLEKAEYAAQLQLPLRFGFSYHLLSEIIHEGRLQTADESHVAHRDKPVLLAEDNVVNQKVAVKMLDHLGLEVDVVTNGRDAVEAVKHQDYGLILMDCQMPDMDGYEATRKIRAYHGLETHIPIIALTAHAMRGDRERCLDAGMDDYLAKPVKIPALKDMLNTWLKGPED